jgi:hypothetical protein
VARQGTASLVERYLRLGLGLGRHLDGLVDAYYGPARLAEEAAAGPARPLPTLVAEARRLLADLEAGTPLDGEPGGSEGAAEGQRRRWLIGQTTGLLTTARRLAGEPVGYVEEVEACYGVRPAPVPEDELADAHRALERLVPGSGPLAERWVAWREAHAVPPERLPQCIDALAEVLRERTAAHLGLPAGEEVHFELVRGQPWSGFNRYHGSLRSTVSINTDLPVLSLSLPVLVAHEAYPGHHTEHSRKEVRLVRGRGWWEESIFLVGTPQCLVAEGLADLGAEALLGPTYPLEVAEVLRGAGVRYDAELAVAVAEPAEVLSAARANAAWRLHVEGADAEEVTEEMARFALVPRARAAKAIEFLRHPTWRAYITCYVAGLPLCRRFVAGDRSRFARLVSEQLLPADLVPPA